MVERRVDGNWLGGDWLGGDWLGGDWLDGQRQKKWCSDPSA
jgi:hypothetical protein